MVGAAPLEARDCGELESRADCGTDTNEASVAELVDAKIDQHANAVLGDTC